MRPTWTYPSRVNGPAWPCTGRGLPGRRVAATPVRSYRTISPLPVRDARAAAPSAVCFCGTFPRVSPGGRYPPPSPCGVRTFLEGFSLPPRSLGPRFDGNSSPRRRRAFPPLADFAEDADDLAEDLRVAGADRLHRLVLGLEPNVVRLAVEALDGGLLADQGDDDFAF